MLNQAPVLQEQTWSQVRNEIAALQPQLATIIDACDPSDDHIFIKVRYPYGEKIVGNGEVKFPTADGEYCLLNDNKHTSRLKNNFGYSVMPIGLLMHNTAEAYITSVEDRIIPYKLYKPGDCFGIWESLKMKTSVDINLPCQWNISAGARSTFMLPKISDAVSHSKLKKAYKLNTHVPTSLDKHWKVFAEINKKSSNNNWYNEVLFFSKHWFDEQASESWYRLQNYWLEQAFVQYSNWKMQSIFELSWDAFCLELEKINLRPKPYQLNTMKHLVSISLGLMPGFRPAQDEKTLPLELIQDAYIYAYGLKHYAPIVMQPDHLVPDSQIKMLYYSLQYPTLPERAFELGYDTSTYKELCKIEELINIFMRALKTNKARLDSTNYNFLEVAKFEFFHNSDDKNGFITPTVEMLQYDSTLNSYPEKYGERMFAEYGHFLRGCVQISLCI
ncbi:hypothetical protein BH10PSE19_BH10PSE19_14670 [soil metagenome]